MKKLLLTTVVLALSLSSAWACSFYPTAFCTLVEKMEEGSALLEFTIVEHINHGIRVEINQVWAGEEARHELIIWDREMIQCNGGFRQETSQYGPVGTRVVAVLQQIDTLASSWEVKGDYRGSVFAFTDGYLALEGGRWKSHYQDLDIGVNIPEGYLGEFLSDCAGVDLTPETPGEFFLSPNPASESVRINRNWSTDTEITVYDLSGRIVATDFFGVEEIDLSLAGLNDGYYIVEVRTGNLVLREKLVVKRG